jgi:glycerol-1-phosphate dehydrogenase [NAD(P)+]
MWKKSYLKELNSNIVPVDEVVGFGGGMSIDAAKYFAWQRELPCSLVPTAISVDACYSYPIALRRNSVVCYEGEVIPKAICVDYDIIRSAPKYLNLSGIGDVLSCYTALFDWRLMSAAGKGPAVVDSLYNYAEGILKELFENTQEFAEMTDKGIQIIMNGYAWVGVEGYNNRFCHFEEGSEHYLAYTIESICGKHLLHGQLVCMCVYIMSKLQQEGRQTAVKRFVDAIGLSIKPEDVGLSYEEIETALRRVNSFAVEKNLSYSVVNEKQVDDDFISNTVGELKSF